MWQILTGSVILSIIHALIPNHWIPLIAISKTEKWSNKETLYATFITGFSHTISTIFIGIIVGFVGIRLSVSYSYITRIAAPIILLVIGIIYFLIDLKTSHHHHFEIDNQQSGNKKSKYAIITSLSIVMFLTPCIEIEAYYFQASTIGWLGILLVSLVYLLITLIIMLALVFLGLKGVNKFKSHYLEYHGKRITGIALIVLAFIAYFIEF